MSHGIIVLNRLQLAARKAHYFIIPVLAHTLPHKKNERTIQENYKLNLNTLPIITGKKSAGINVYPPPLIGQGKRLPP